MKFNRIIIAGALFTLGANGLNAAQRAQSGQMETRALQAQGTKFDQQTAQAEQEITAEDAPQPKESSFSSFLKNSETRLRNDLGAAVDTKNSQHVAAQRTVFNAQVSTLSKGVQYLTDRLNDLEQAEALSGNSMVLADGSKVGDLLTQAGKTINKLDADFLEQKKLFFNTVKFGVDTATDKRADTLRECVEITQQLIAALQPILNDLGGLDSIINGPTTDSSAYDFQTQLADWQPTAAVK